RNSWQFSLAFYCPLQRCFLADMTIPTVMEITIIRINNALWKHVNRIHRFIQTNLTMGRESISHNEKNNLMRGDFDMLY
ncbi:MAG: hypothetical protein ACTJFN_12155, partial [Sphingobacterium sp.]